MAIRVLVVDDSAFMRRVVSEAIAAQPDMEVAGVAINGLDALVKVEQLQPDVVTLDVEMPDMDGLTALRHLMARYPPTAGPRIRSCSTCRPGLPGRWLTDSIAPVSCRSARRPRVISWRLG